MNCDYYRVLYDGIVLAEKMTLETALILLKALFEHYYNEPLAHYTIEKQEEDTE